MAYEWKDKVVVITGAASGIGETVVRFLMDEKVGHVAILDVAEQAGLALENELNSKYGASKVKFYKFDVTNDVRLTGTFESVKRCKGRIDVVINNAGLMNDSHDCYINEIAINVTAVITGTIKAQELMSKEHGGSGGTVINISSVAGLTKSPLMPVYWATKAAVIQFSNCIGHEEKFAKTGVRVFSICYGTTDTSLIDTSKLGTFDRSMSVNELAHALWQYPIQRPESAARGLIEAYKKADSGSVWLVNAGKPPVDITDKYNRFYKDMEELIMNT